MMDMTTIRERFPQYRDLPDADLADALHRRYYSDMPRDEFMRRIGMADQSQPQPPPGVIIHDTGGRSYSPSDPDIAIDRTGMSTEGATRASYDLQRRASASARARDDGMIPSAMRRAAPIFQGLTSSGGDELVSGAYAGVQSALGRETFDDAYNYAQDMQQQMLDARREEAPIMSALEQGAGNVAMGLSLGRFLPFPRGSSLFNQGLAGGGYGLVGGGIDGFLSGSGTDDRLDNAQIGAVAGAVGGVAAPFAFRAGQEVIERGLDYVSTDRALRQMGLSRPAGDMITRRLAADDALEAGGIGQINMSRAGPDATFADAGPATRGQLDAAIQRGGPGSTVALRRVSRRLDENLGVLNQTFDVVFGGRPQGVRAHIQGLRNNAGDLGLLYRRAYARPVDYAHPTGRRLEALLPRVPPEALAKANRLMTTNGVPTNKQIIFRIGDDGSILLQRMPDTEQWDYIKRGIRGLAETGEDAGAMGKRTDISTAYMNLAGEIRSALGNNNPLYDQAVKAAEIPIRGRKAINLGYQALTDRMTRDDFFAELAEFSVDERSFVRAGIRERIDDTLARLKTAASNADFESLGELRRATADMTSRANREKLQAVLGRREYRRLVRDLDRAQRSLLLKAETAANSRTAGRQATLEEGRQALEPGAVGSVTRGRPLQAGQRAVQTVFGTRPQDDLAREDELYRQVSDFLLTPRGAASQRVLDELNAAYRAAERNSSIASNTGKALGMSTGTALYHEGRQFLEGEQ